MPDKTIKILDKIIEIVIYGLIFIIPFSKAGIEILATIAIAVWLLKQFITHKLDVRNYFPKTPLTPPALTVFAVFFISMIFSVDMKLSLEGVFLKLGEYLLLFLMCSDIFSKREKRILPILSAVLVSSVVLLFADAGFQWVTARDFIRGFRSTPNLRACFATENDFAGYIITVLPVLFCMVFISFKHIKPAARVLIKFSGLILFLSGSILLGKTFARGAWLGYLASACFLILLGLFLSQKRKIKNIFNIFIVLWICAFLITGLAFKPVKERLMSITNGFAASQQRLHYWQEAVSIIKDFPILGTGPNTYTKVIPSYSKSKISGAYPHNSYLQMAAETGILGLVAFLWLLYRFFGLGIAAMLSKTGIDDEAYMLLGVMAGIFAVLVQSFFDTNLYSLTLVTLLWVFLGIGASLSLRLMPGKS